MKSSHRALVLVGTLGLLVSALALAAGPGDPDALIPYQGRLERGGAVVTGPHTFEFSIYDDPSAVPGSAGFLWRETQSNVPVTLGAFGVTLGTQTTLPNTVFNLDALYLSIGVSDGSGPVVNLGGLQRLQQNPYTVRAATADFAVRAASAAAADLATRATSAAVADDLVPTGSLSIFGTWSTLAQGALVATGSSIGEQAATDGLVMAFASSSIGGHMRINGRVDLDGSGSLNDNDNVIRVADRVEAGEVMQPLTFAVKRGQLWAVHVRPSSAGAVTLTVRFLPFGS